MAPPKPEPVKRLGDILRSEPATEALLLTQVAPPADEASDEIVTAHAKPVARKIAMVEAALPIDRRLRRGKSAAKGSGVRFPGVSRAMENLGLIALLVFGLGLVALGVSTYFGSAGDGIAIAAASAVAAPGLAAVLMAAFGLWRGPQAKSAQAQA